MRKQPVGAIGNIFKNGDEIAQEMIVARCTRGADIARLYPKVAMGLQIDGRAIVGCAVDSYGALEACSVESAEPPKLGFGEAACEAQQGTGCAKAQR